MSSFTQFDADLLISYDREASDILGKDHWRVAQSFRYYLNDATGRYVEIPRGYLTDGASAPQFLWSVVPPWGPYGQAAVVHDFLCENLYVLLEGQKIKITRRQADEIFDEAMKVLKVPEGTREKMMVAVHTYRVVAGTDEPTINPVKNNLERNWYAREQLKEIKTTLGA